MAGALLTPVAGRLFQHSDRQAQLEAALAWGATGLALLCLVLLRSRRSAYVSLGIARPRDMAGVLGAAAAFLLLRQFMEIEVVLRLAIFEVRSQEATLQTAGGLLVGLLLVLLAGWGLLRLRDGGRRPAALTFSALFAAQSLLYAVHESAESGWLPWSDPIHLATELYGPDGQFGPIGSVIVLLGPFAAAMVAAGWRRRPSRRVTLRSRPAAAAVAALFVAVTLWAGGRLWEGETRERVSAAALVDAPGAEPMSLAVAPGSLLARHTNIDRDYGVVSISALQSPAARELVRTLACERLSFAGGVGICLQSERGFFTRYRAVLFDSGFRALRTLDLEGSPSRTRVSADGRVGAITVFTTANHNYASTESSTATTLVDLSTGDLLGNLESFSVWRNGQRFKEADFNFWGVTFASDSRVFYATLRTGAQTFLVKGDLALRKLTVVRENVECPSLSPDNRLLAFKKRVGAAADPWRLYVLDLQSMAERPISAETRSVDDQIEWLDNQRVLYGIPRPASPAVRDVWMAPVDGGQPPRIYLSESESPIVVR